MFGGWLLVLSKGISHKKNEENIICNVANMTAESFEQV